MCACFSIHIYADVLSACMYGKLHRKSSPRRVLDGKGRGRRVVYAVFKRVPSMRKGEDRGYDLCAYPEDDRGEERKLVRGFPSLSSASP